MTDLILDLIRTNRGPMPLETLVHELTVMRATVRKDLPQVTAAVVRIVLDKLMRAGHVAFTSNGWQAVYPQAPEQRKLF